MSASPTVNETEWTIGRLLSWTSSHLAENGIEEPRLAAEVLLAHSAACRRIDLYARFDANLGQDQLDTYRGLVKRAAAGEPIAYLVGAKEFFSLSFRVTPAVLIPRPETETVVEVAIEHCSEVGLENPSVMDFGTGSGCVAVALLAQMKEARVVATDVSAEALEIALANAERHGVSDRIVVVEADGLEIPAENIPSGGFNMLVSNPPYISRADMKDLETTVGEYEPHDALAGGEDGLDFYRRIGSGAAKLLAGGGVVILEIGDGQAPAVIDTMTGSNAFVHRGTWKDRVTKRERVLMFGSCRGNE